MANGFAVQPGWRVLFKDLGLEAVTVLRRAGLPEDLLTRPQATLTTEQYFSLWEALDATSDDGTLPLQLGAAISVEAFDPPVFAALCSPDLNTALQRIAHYKRLVMPLQMRVEVGKRSTSMRLQWTEATVTPPVALMTAELVFFVQLARIATRTRVCPLEITSPKPIRPSGPYTAYFGVPVREGRSVQLVFRAQDAVLPFLTANEALWKSFEPQLQQRLAALEEGATLSQRARSALIELIPSGQASMPTLAKKLGTSSRTLQRRLDDEGTSFQALLKTTREDLARHYLQTSTLSGAEISFLLGFSDPNSFFRAFHEWTGETSERFRSRTQQLGVEAARPLAQAP